jgi:streptogramin lyase
LVLALFEDRDGTLWAGNERGLERLDDPDFRPLGEPEGLTDASAFGVLEDSTGAMWIATDAGAFRVGGTITNVAADRGTVYALHEDAHGAVWIGARDGSVGRWQDGKFAWLWKGAWEKVRAIHEADGALWFGTDHGLFRQRGDRLEQAEPVVPGPIVSAIARDESGALWLGTEGKGLLRFQSDRLVPIPDGGPPTSSSVTTLTLDPDGTMWVGTEGDGLWRLRDARWASFTSKDGLFDDLVWRILDDGHGQLWFSSNRGIWRVRRADLEARASGSTALIESFVYGEADGMRDRECNGAITPAGWRAHDGRLWFPTGNGVAIVDPARLRPSSTPAALLENVRVDGKEKTLGGALVLPPGSSRFELQYTAPELRSPERVRFRYRLEGFDTAWNAPGSERLAQYTNLSPGSYHFVVQATTGGEWGKEGRLDVTLLPRFYQTAWFYALSVVLGLLAILAIPLLRVRQLRAREAELARRVQEALSEVKVLSGMLPICAWCKKIRDDQGYWNKIEAYLHERTNARFTHGMCPECFEKLDAEADEEDEKG